MNCTRILFLAFLSANCFAQLDLTSNLVICMPMNGNANDFSGNNNNGIISGATPTVNRFGVANSAYHFDGIDDFIAVQPSASIDSIEANSEVTITAWCHVNNWYQGWNIFSILEKYDSNTDSGWGFCLENPSTNAGFNDLAFFANPITQPANNECNAAVAFNQWDFYAVTFSRSAQVCKLYKNGVLLYTNPTSTVVLYNTNSAINIGYSPAGPEEYNDGDMDEIRLYNRALTDLEISALYILQSECNSGAGPVTTFTPGSNQICSGQAVTFTDQSTGNPTAWSWQLPGGSPAVSSSSMPVVSFASAGIYTVSLITSNTLGISNVAVQTITVLPAPAPLFNSNSPICVSADLQLAASGASSYTWTGPANYSTTVQNPVIPSVSLSADGLYTLTVINAEGCLVSNIIAVTILSDPTPSVAGASVCEGASAILSADGGISYQWQGPGNFTSGIQTPTIPVVVNFLPDVYTVTVTGANSCTASAVATVIALPNPTLSTTGTVVCYGSPAVLTATGAITYTWDGPMGFNNGAALTVPSANNLSIGFYTVTGTAVNGCSTSAVVSLNAMPLPFLSATSAAVCSGQSASLTASGANTFNWTGPGGYAASGQMISLLNVNNVQPQTYTVVGTAANSCTSAVVATLVALPNPVIITTGATVCYGSSANLFASGASSYTWTGPSPTNFGPGLFIPVANNLSSGVYTVTGILSANSCTNSTTVSLNTLPLPLLSVNNATVCHGQLTQLTANGCISYAWTGPSAFSAGTSSILLNGGAPGISVYTVVGTAANSCTNVATASVLTNPQPVLTLNAAATQLCQGQTTTLTASGAQLYSWSPPSGNSPIIVVTPSSTIVYSLTGVDANNCSAVSTITITLNKCVGLYEIANTTTGVTVYPNPSSGTFYIKASGAFNLHLVNGLGQLIRIIDLNEKSHFEFTVQDLSQGVYYLRSTGSGEVISRKIVIESK